MYEGEVLRYSLAVVVCHDALLVGQQRVSIAHAVCGEERLVGEVEVGEHDVLHSHKHQGEVRSAADTLSSARQERVGEAYPVNMRAQVE